MKLNNKTIANLLEKGLKKAEKMGLGNSIAFVDESGLLTGFLRHPVVEICSIQFAIDKAYTALINRLSTEELGEICQPGQELYGLQNNLGGRMVIFGGGIPIWNQSKKLIGAVGVSGGSVQQDIEVATYIVDQFRNN